MKIAISVVFAPRLRAPLWARRGNIVFFRQDNVIDPPRRKHPKGAAAFIAMGFFRASVPSSYPAGIGISRGRSDERAFIPGL